RYYSERHGIEAPRVLEDAMARLTSYDWPGNVRELKNAAERIVVRARSGVVTPADLPPFNTASRSDEAATPRGVTVAIGSADGTAPQPAPDALLERLRAGESFWSAVYEPFMGRDITRNDIRTLVNYGLAETCGSYK